jgi:hypothetical protein
MNPGAIYYNAYYPGPIGLPENSVFQVKVEGRDTLLFLVRHLRPVAVTDFGNDFTLIVDGTKRHLALKRPIPALDPDLITVDIRTTAGKVETIAGYGKGHEYVLYRRPSFTEFTLGVEVSSLENPESNESFLLTAIEKLLLLYRVATTDVRVALPDRLKQDFPVIRTLAVAYKPVAPRFEAYDRVLAHFPRVFVRPTIMSYKEYEKFLPVFRHDIREMAARIGHHLASGTEVSDAQQALTDSFDVLVSGGSPRFVLVEALSVAEVLVFDLLNTVRTSRPELDRKLKRIEGRHRLTLAKALGFLPEIMGSDLPKREAMADLYRAVERRNKTLHERLDVGTEDATSALNAVQQLLFAVERVESSVG